MRRRETWLVTGATGFIGSAFARRLASVNERPRLRFLARNAAPSNLVRLAGRHVLLDLPPGDEPEFFHGDLTGDVSGCCEGADVVVHFAAKTFVDHSIRDPQPFVDVNTMGTLRLLEDARKCGVRKFLLVGTDEVYGQILEGYAKEDAPLNPRNPYAASKASADALAICYAHTYGMNTLVTRTENNYGPFQSRQKALPTFFRNALAGVPLPVYGDGKHVRQWLWVDDHVDALLLLLRSDTAPGSIYHVAGCHEVTNFELACKVIGSIHKARAREMDPDWPTRLIRLVPDHDVRPGHDRRYALDSSKVRALGWQPRVGLEEGIDRLRRWYIDNKAWL